VSWVAQELATVFVHNLPVKTVVLNNQHLGMVVQWEDRFYKHNRAHTYLGKSDAEWHVTYNEADIYPDLPLMAKSCGVKARRVIKKEELREAVRCDALSPPVKKRHGLNKLVTNI
jgi:acetolactate synthase-1/2/3 large subunit